MTGSGALAALLPGVEQPPPNAPEFGGSSPIALVVILLLALALFFLIRSMNTHLRRVPESFPEQSPTPGTDPAPDPAAEPGGQDHAPGPTPQ